MDIPGFTPLSISPDIDAAPWTDLNVAGLQHGLVRRVGFLRNATVQGRGGIALAIQLDDGGWVVAETTYRLAHAAARAIAVSPAAAEEDLS
jgi:hypothetical protein